MRIILDGQRTPTTCSIPSATIIALPLVLRGHKRLGCQWLEGKINSTFSLPDYAIFETDTDAPTRWRILRTGPVAAPLAHPPDKRTYCPRKQDYAAVACTLPPLVGLIYAQPESLEVCHETTCHTYH